MTAPKSSKKATSHGAYSAQVVLPWESESEFNDLHQAFVEQLNPDGEDEEGLVFDLVCLRWKKRRLNFGSQLAFRRAPDARKLTDAGQKGGWEAIADYLAPSAQNADNLRAMVFDSAKKCSDSSTYVCDRIAQLAPMIGAPASTPASATKGSMPAGATEPPSETSADQMAGLTALLKMLAICSADLAGALRQLEDNNGRLCELAYHPEIFERELKIHAMLDKQMEKTMARLVMTKEYKKMYLPKLIGLPTGTTTLAPSESNP